MRERDGPAVRDPAAAAGCGRPARSAQQRGLAGTVDADEADPVARAEAPGGVREQRRAPRQTVDVLEVDDVLAEPRGGELLQLAAVARRRHVLDELVGGVDAELRLGRTRRGAAAQPGQLLADQVLAASSVAAA